MSFDKFGHFKSGINMVLEMPKSPLADLSLNSEYEMSSLSNDDLQVALYSIMNQLDDEGCFVASIRDYDELLKYKPPYSPPYIHKTERGQRVSFQTWQWDEDIYKLVQYIIDDETSLGVNKFECSYRATKRSEITDILTSYGCGQVEWKFPEETGFYQPIVIAKK